MICIKCKQGEMLFYTQHAVFKFENGNLIRVGYFEAKVQCGKCGFIDRVMTFEIVNQIKEIRRGNEKGIRF